jgi:hypothetical protein
MKDGSNVESYDIGFGLEKNVTCSPVMIVAKSKKQILQRKISIQMAILLTRSSRLCLFAGNEGVCIKALCAEFGALSSSAASSPSMSSPTNPKENAADMSARFPLYIGVSRRAPRMQGAKLPMMVCRKNGWQRSCQEVFHPQFRLPTRTLGA